MHILDYEISQVKHAVERLNMGSTEAKDFLGKNSITTNVSRKNSTRRKCTCIILSALPSDLKEKIISGTGILTVIIIIIDNFYSYIKN